MSVTYEIQHSELHVATCPIGKPLVTCHVGGRSWFHMTCTRLCVYIYIYVIQRPKRRKVIDDIHLSFTHFTRYDFLKNKWRMKFRHLCYDEKK